MDQMRKSTDSESDQYLRVAVEVRNKSFLMKINITLSLEDIIQVICSEHDIPYKPEEFSLMFKDVAEETIKTKYITEKNKSQVKDGAILLLSYSPKRTVSSIAKDLFKDEIKAKADALKRIADQANDAVFLKELNAQNAVKEVLKILKIVKPPNFLKPQDEDVPRTNVEDIAVNAFRILENCLIRGYASNLPSEGIEMLLHFVSSSEPLPTSVLLLTLRILILLTRKRKLKYPTTMLDDILPHIWHREEPVVQENALKLINYLFLYANSDQERKHVFNFLSSKNMIRYICENILNGVLRKGMKQQLYVFQTIALKKYNQRFRLLISESDEMYKILSKASNSDFSIAENMLIADEDGFEIPGNFGLKRSHKSRSLQSLTQGVLGNLRSSFRRIRTFSAGSSSENDEQPTFCNFRTRAQSMDRNENKKVSGFTNYVELDYSSKLFGTNLSFSFDEKLDTKIIRQLKNNVGNRRVIINETTPKTRAKSASSIVKEKPMDKLSIPTEKSARPATSPKARKANRTGREEKQVVSKLAFDNILYYARHDNKSYRKWFFGSKENPRSILHLANDITRLLCVVLEVSSQSKIDESSENFHPLFFHCCDFFLEDLFCLTIPLFMKTWKEMKARVESDRPKVLDVVKEQIIAALNTRPVPLKMLQESLMAVPYEVIAKRRGAELVEQIKWELSHKPAFLKLRELLTPEIMSVIRKHRMLFIEEGEHVPRINVRGQKIKKTGLFVFVTKNHEFLQIDDCQDEPCDHKMGRRVPISDILEVVTGKESNFYKEVLYTVYSERDMFFRPGVKQQKIVDLDFPVSLKLQDETYVNFCAKNESSMDYWADGINMLLRKPMTSQTYVTELNEFLDMEVRLHFLEVEGIPLPDVPPAIPPEPPNYNFLVK